MLKNVIAVALLLLLSNSAFAELKGLNCLGTEPFWGLEVDVVKNQLAFKTEADEKPQYKKIKKPLQAYGVGENMVMVFKSLKQDISATVISSNIAGKACSDGMSDTDYPYHVVYRNADMVVYGCCEPKE